ncbi:hypothetical protein C0J52_26397 [Blattella germanica]|nr:hypothetical protein C0J52_26397 [Blattella germanica]
MKVITERGFTNNQWLPLHHVNSVLQFRSLFRKPITIQEALDIINEEENKPQQSRSEIDAIYIAPPEPDILTDEDSGDKEQAGLIDNLNGRQLRANAEIKLKSNMEVSNSNDDISEDNISPNKFSVHSSVVPDDSMSNHPPSNSGGQNTLVDVNVLEALKFSSNKRKENKTQWIKDNKKWRGAGEGCSSIMRTMCKKCGVEIIMHLSSDQKTAGSSFKIVLIGGETDCDFFKELCCCMAVTRGNKDRCFITLFLMSAAIATERHFSVRTKLICVFMNKLNV